MNSKGDEVGMEEIYGKEIMAALKTPTTLFSLLPTVQESAIWNEMKEKHGWKYHTKKRRELVKQMAKDAPKGKRGQP